MMNKLTRHFNALSEAELERLAILIEECAEVQQMGCKILRHGYDSDNNGKMLEPNRKAIAREVGDLLHAINRLIDAQDIDGISVSAHSSRKSETIQTWLHHQGRTPKVASTTTEAAAK